LGLAEFDRAYQIVSELADRFRAHERRYLSADYQEAECRKDFIDKFWKALGWDVDHDAQKNPYEQEVKVERGTLYEGTARKRADYAFFLAPNFRDVRFFVEAKKPSCEFGTPEHYFQTLCYGWGNKTAKQHQSSWPEPFLDCLLQFGIGLRPISRFPKFSHVRMTDRGIERRNYLIKRFGRVEGESLYFDLPYHLISPFVENSSPNMGGRLFDCPLISFHQGSLSKKR